MRVLLPLLVLIALAALFGAGVLVGRAGRRRTVRQVLRHVDPVATSARNLASMTWTDDPVEADLRRRETLLVLEQYDRDRRDALS
jgi:hypothetical protein